MDYNTIKELGHVYDHQIILNEADPMVDCIRQFQHVITTPGDPTSELLAALLRDRLNGECRKQGIAASVRKIRVWESPGCYAELGNE
jgi:6-pyruvoyltetrahydropterin/6-carboxytetrahydropterin synthase